ncbi:hypothetical protein [Parageobacillus galactosidasius]|uniref:Uncharacterized protein n=1 Tax=Parageobacillus galactosidasius TaxID=883812 RepID=A0A226QQI4_9BACL|nr:hypothetical protein [Parageobacillus galactosidasius]OXB94796.1 hypothetical protein B9L23_08010 [Parageobacillus galactosidasius]
MIYFVNKDTNLANIDIEKDIVLERYELDLNNDFSINFAGSYPLNEVVNFPGNGFYYSDYGFKDEFEIYYVEVNRDNTELYFYEVFKHVSED